MLPQEWSHPPGQHNWKPCRSTHLVDGPRVGGKLAQQRAQRIHQVLILHVDHRKAVQRLGPAQAWHRCCAQQPKWRALQQPGRQWQGGGGGASSHHCTRSAAYCRLWMI